MKNEKKAKRNIRHRRVRAKIKGTGSVPRLCVFRSNKHIYCQLIDDEKNKTLFIASDIEMKNSRVVRSRSAGQKSKVAEQVGELMAKKAIEKKIEKVVFDRAGYKYHGRIKALADGARKGGLKF
jgi:large subunit ribosomal protein L18